MKSGVVRLAWIWSHSAIILLLNPSNLGAQKLDGTYSGKLMSPDNLLIIVSKDRFVNGNVYLEAYKKLPFVGTLEKSRLSGAFVLEDGSEALVIFEIRVDSLVGDFYTSTDTVHTCLRLVSRSKSFDPVKFFLGDASGHDPNLIGKWARVKEFDNGGKEIKNRTYQLELFSDGTSSPDISLIKEYYRDFNLKNHSNLKPPDASQLGRKTWRTTSNSLILAYDKMPQETILTYEISADTLKMITLTGSKEIYLKVKK